MLILLAVVANLAALVSGQDVKFELPLYGVEMGSTAIMGCLIKGKKFDGFYGPSGDRLETNKRITINEYVSSGRYELNMINVQESDHGTYKCRAEDKEEASAVLIIRVSVMDIQTLYKMAVGDRGQIKLYVAGYPRPRIIWEKEESADKYAKLAERAVDGKVTGDSRYDITSEGSLWISNVVNGDAGSYRVRAPYLGGEATKSTVVEVGEKPKLEKTPVEKLSVTLGGEIKLDCKFVEDLMPSWQHNSTEGVTSSLSNVVGRVQITKESLTISNAVRSDEGSYYCSGKNTYGERRTKTVLENVITPPKVEALKNVEVGEGEKLSLNCSATGYPKPSVKWHVKRDGKFVELERQKMSPGNSVFMVDNVTDEHRGTYKCTADNMAMKDGKPLIASAEMDVLVLTKPSITAASLPAELKYVMGKNETKSLNCVALGFPVPVVVFLKDGKKIDKDVTSASDAQSTTATLQYMVTSQEDLGSIKCMASNAQGNVTRSTNIVAITVPGAPTNVASQEVETTYVKLTWSAPAQSGGDQITGYEVTVTSPGMKPITKSVIKTEIQIDNLQKDTEYTITVKATNQAGPSAASQTFTVKTRKLSLPGSPIVNNVPQQLSTNEIPVSWSKPTDDGGAASLTYKVTVCKYDPKSGTYPSCVTLDAGTNTSTVVKNLVPNSQYKVTVTAHNNRGMGKSSTFKTITGKSTSKPEPETDGPKTEERGLGGGAIAGIVIAVILIILIVVDLFCCFFNNCGFTHCCYETFCAGKAGKSGKYEAAKSEEKQELQEKNNKPAAETV